MERQIELEEKLYGQLAARAAKRGISTSDYVHRALNWYLRQIKKTEEGMNTGVQSMKIMAQDDVDRVFKP